MAQQGLKGGEGGWNLHLRYKAFNDQVREWGEGDGSSPTWTRLFHTIAAQQPKAPPPSNPNQKAQPIDLPVLTNEHKIFLCVNQSIHGNSWDFIITNSIRKRGSADRKDLLNDVCTYWNMNGNFSGPSGPEAIISQQRQTPWDCSLPHHIANR